MKVVILTSSPHWEFVTNATSQYSEHEFWISEKTMFPDEYDVGISFMHLGKIPAEQIISHTWFNFHPGPLPEYRGRNLCYHAIMNGEREFGATVHYMDESFDTGDIIEVYRFPILHWDTAGDLSSRTMWVSQRAFELYLPRILSGEKFARIPNVDGTYYKKLPIDDTMFMTGTRLGNFVRAVTYKNFYPKINVGGVVYKIVRDE